MSKDKRRIANDAQNAMPDMQRLKDQMIAKMNEDRTVPVTVIQNEPDVREVEVKVEQPPREVREIKVKVEYLRDTEPLISIPLMEKEPPEPTPDNITQSTSDAKTRIINALFRLPVSLEQLHRIEAILNE